VAEIIPTKYHEKAMFPWNKECCNLWCLSGRQPFLELCLPRCQETGYWQVVHSEAVGDVHVYRAWPGGRAFCPFCGAVVLGRLLGLNRRLNGHLFTVDIETGVWQVLFIEAASWGLVRHLLLKLDTNAQLCTRASHSFYSV
jgi:hypothetical protein